MDNHQSDRVLAFDSLFTTNHIQMLKLLVGYMDPTVQGKIAIYIKFMELQHTMKMVTNHPALSVSPCQSADGPGPLTALLDEMYPFCRPEEKEHLQNIKNMFQTFENMQEMMEMIEVLREIAPEMFSGTENGGPDFSQMMNMSQGMDMSQMMDMMNMMQGIFSSPNESN
ncbi:MAG: hypothetical protein E7292_01475 [Lachnospiraceae bacterium]|nr:hypothetical protein [Lachnospiraceae bacterium]